MTDKFISFNLDRSILKALKNLGYNNPSTVQKEVIPKLINRENVIVKSKTGSGKTASFAIPICQNIDVDSAYVQALIVVPTRELAIQVKEEISNIGRLRKIRCSAIFGRQSIKEQIRELKQRVHVVVATPGRIIDHIGRGTIDLNNINYFIIDEADKMLNKGFVDDMEFIFDKVNKYSTKGLFSATIDNDIKTICDNYMKDNNIIEINSKETLNKNQIEEKKYEVEENDKYDTLKKFIYSESPKTVIIFCNTRERVMRVFEKMKKDRFLVGQLHGEMSQDKRIFIIKDFKAGKFNILVSTDVASRGIHIDDISLVINYDVPHDKENYIHRIGRTGRKDSYGKSITLVSERDKRYLKEIEDYTQYKIEEVISILEEDIQKGKIKFEERSKRVLKERKTKVQENNVHSEITRLYLNAGKRKKIRVIDIVGALSNIDGIHGEDIGVIDVRDLCSYVDILNYKGDAILKKYKEISIKKKLVQVRKDKQS